MAKFDVLKLCKYLGDHYEVDPGVMFPATIARIQEWLTGADVPEIVGGDYATAVQFQREAKSIPAEAWELALIPFELCLEAKRPMRATALAFADNFFSRALSLAVGGAVHIHVIRNDDYRR